jgi:Lrp/AsnC family leucine-responsive transcriptional regulator
MLPKFGAKDGRNAMKRKLDPFDIQLLNLLQADNLATAETLAREVALSPSAIARRLRAYRDEGLIAANIALLEPELTADRLRAIVQVQVHEHAEERGIAALRARLAAAPEVQLLLNIAGPVDLLVLVVTRSMREFNAFADRHFAEDPAVRRYETSFVKAEIKNRPSVWLDARDCDR